MISSMQKEMKKLAIEEMSDGLDLLESWEKSSRRLKTT
jgi:hypothetical protein